MVGSVRGFKSARFPSVQSAEVCSTVRIVRRKSRRLVLLNLDAINVLPIYPPPYVSHGTTSILGEPLYRVNPPNFEKQHETPTRNRGGRCAMSVLGVREGVNQIVLRESSRSR